MGDGEILVKGYEFQLCGREVSEIYKTVGSPSVIIIVHISKVLRGDLNVLTTKRHANDPAFQT